MREVQTLHKCKYVDDEIASIASTVYLESICFNVIIIRVAMTVRDLVDSALLTTFQIIRCFVLVQNTNAIRYVEIDIGIRVFTTKMSSTISCNPATTTHSIELRNN